MVAALGRRPASTCKYLARLFGLSGNIEGSGQCNSSPDYQVGFFESVDKDLLESFWEAEGEPCTQSLKYNASFYTA
jgi:hypothetical protein